MVLFKLIIVRLFLFWWHVQAFTDNKSVALVNGKCPGDIYIRGDRYIIELSCTNLTLLTIWQSNLPSRGGLPYLSIMDSFLCPDKILIYFRQKKSHTDPLLYGQRTQNLAPREQIHIKVNLLITVITELMIVCECDTISGLNLHKHQRNWRFMKIEIKHHNRRPKMIKEKKSESAKLSLTWLCFTTEDWELYRIHEVDWLKSILKAV